MKQPNSLLKWATLLAATGVVLYLCWQILRPFLDIITWSVVLAITFHPVHQRLVRRIAHPSLSAFISTMLVVLTILVPLVFLTGLIINEFLSLKDTLVSKFQEGFDLSRIPVVREAMEWLYQHFRVDSAKLADSIKQYAAELARRAAAYSFTFAGNVTSLIVSFVFTVFTMFYLFRDGNKIVAKIPDLLPLQRSQSERLILRIRDVIDGSIYGVLVIALIQGALMGVIFGLLNIPSPVLWGTVTAFTSLIPLVGAAGVWVPGTLYLLLTGEWGKALILAAFGGLVISSVDNFLRPKLVGGRVRLEELVMFFSVLGGLEVFGVLGIVAGPVVFAIAGSLFDTLRYAEWITDSPPEPGRVVEG
jgi:predicted PurR-regulated permease PerM